MWRGPNLHLFTPPQFLAARGHYGRPTRGSTHGVCGGGGASAGAGAGADRPRSIRPPAVSPAPPAAPPASGAACSVSALLLGDAAATGSLAPPPAGPRRALGCEVLGRATGRIPGQQLLGSLLILLPNPCLCPFPAATTRLLCTPRRSNPRRSNPRLRHSSLRQQHLRPCWPPLRGYRQPRSRRQQACQRPRSSSWAPARARPRRSLWPACFRRWRTEPTTDPPTNLSFCSALQHTASARGRLPSEWQAARRSHRKALLCPTYPFCVLSPMWPPACRWLRMNEQYLCQLYSSVRLCRSHITGTRENRLTNSFFFRNLSVPLPK